VGILGYGGVGAYGDASGAVLLRSKEYFQRRPLFERWHVLKRVEASSGIYHVMVLGPGY